MIEDRRPKTEDDVPTLISRVGVVGAGRMGLPIIGHLVRRGFVVTAQDIDPARRGPVEQAGGQWGTVGGAEAVLICVGYDAELRALMSAQGSLLPTLAKGTIVAVSSTVAPRTVRELAAVAAAAGVNLVDATVARGGRAADAGTLLAFVGGEAAVVERLRPVLAAFASDIVHTGGVGTAQVAKAANNLVMWACLIADHEALALAHRFGVDVDRLREALTMSSADNYVLRHWGQNTMAWADDDMAIVEAMAQEVGVALPQAGLNRELCRLLKPTRFQLGDYGV